MSVLVEPNCTGEIEYTFLGLAVTTTNNCPGHSRAARDWTSQALEERPQEKKARSQRRTRAIARRLVKGVFQFPLCCRPSTVGDDDGDDEFTVTEYSKHLPYKPRKVPEAMNQLVPHQATEVRSPHLPHVLRKTPAMGSQLQRKVIIYPPNWGSTIPTNGQWKIGFEDTNMWESPLHAWSLTGDAYLGVGEPGLDFDCREDAILYAQKYGWSYRVEGELVKHRRNKSIGTFGWVELMRPAVKT